MTEASEAFAKKLIFTMGFTIGWYVIYVKSRWENKVNEALQELLIESFLPKIRVVRIWSDRKKTIFKPLFPSYVFVKINTSLEFQRTLSISGVHYFVTFGKEYTLVAEKEITLIKLLVGDLDITDIEIDSKLPKVGDIKKIIHGPLSGIECEVIEVGGVNKVIVQLHSLQQNIRASIPSYYFNK